MSHRLWFTLSSPRAHWSAHKRFKLTGYKPAEEEERRQRVPGHADSTERVDGAVFGGFGAGQAGERRQAQAKDSRHDQIDGDVVLPRTVIQMHCT